MTDAATVPDFFQEETAEALRSQVDWLAREVGLGDSFFARVLKTDENTFAGWRVSDIPLPEGAEDTLRLFWQTTLHLLSFLNFDTVRVRELFRYVTPQRSGGTNSRLAPPWGGSSLQDYLERNGAPALEALDGWVTQFRFGDPNAI